MNKDWKSHNIVIGPVAIGSEFYHRSDIVEDIWIKLQKGNCVLLAAPRRVGKTSVMQYMEENPIDNYQLIFQNIQGIDTAEKFYERIYTLLLNCLNTTKKAKEWIINFFTSKSIKSITKDGIEFDTKPVDFSKAITTLLAEINKNEEVENIVLLLDELPEVLFNISKTNNADAISILKFLRHWEQQPELNRKVKFVIAGSVGIHYVVEKIETRNADLNNLAKVYFEPLSDSEAHNYIDWATKGATVTYSPKLKTHLLGKIKYFVPYFINLLIDEIDRQAKKANNPKIATQNIDTAFDIIVKNNEYFEDWKMRLRNYMSPEDFNFVNEILTHVAHKEYISLQEIYDKAVKHEKTTDYMKFIGDLEKDGYIVEIENKYRFISPYLSVFWKRNNPIYNA